MNEKQTTKPVPDFLSDPIRGIMEAEDILAKLFRIICLDLNIGPEMWLVLLERYLDKPENGVGKSVSARSTEKSNLKRALESNTMTMKVFQKALRFLGDFESTFTVTLKDPVTGEQTEHNIILRAPRVPRNATAVTALVKDNKKKRCTVHSTRVEDAE